MGKGKRYLGAVCITAGVLLGGCGSGTTSMENVTENTMTEATTETRH